MSLNLPDEKQGLLEKIFYLTKITDHIFFRKFEGKFDLSEGMNFTHMKAAMMIRFNGQCNLSKLSHLMNLEKGSLTPVVGKLLELGVVEKVQSREDKRVYYLSLTERGQALTEEFRLAHHRYIRQKIETLKPQEQVEYFHLIERLNQLNRKLSDII